MALLPRNQPPPVPWGDVGATDWGSRRVFLLGGGASLKGFDFERLRSRGLSVGINQSMFDVDFCECGISIDQTFVQRFHDEIEAVAAVKPVYLVLGNYWWNNTRPIRGATYINDPARRGTSGFAALQIALRKGAKQITLLGFDYVKGHYHDKYPWRMHDKANDMSWGRWAEHFKPIPGVDIVNASERSLIQCYKKMSISEALALSD